MTLIFSHRKNRDKKLLAEAKNLISAANKVIKYRRHLLSSESISHIKTLIDNIETASGTDKIGEQLHILSSYLKEHGGDIFPIKFLNDNTEVLFVAALLAIAIRTFFIQSFQIPTNSMYPTYSGITYKIKTDEKETLAKKLLNKIRFFGTEIYIPAKNDGEILIPLARVNSTNQSQASYIVPYEILTVKRLGGLMNTRVRVYTIFVGDTLHKIATPADFSLDKVLMESFYGAKTSWGEIAADKNLLKTNSRGIYLLETNTFAKENEILMHFEIVQGDMLLVDKISYNFSAPKIGDSLVFITDKIETFKDSPKFFIKRLVGQPSDTISIQDDKLIRNGAAICSNSIFEKINSKSEGYENGYKPSGMLADRNEITIPEKQFFVLGDNSADSYDSRFWGFVPKKSVRGRPLVIFYPFSNRFGRCK